VAARQQAQAADAEARGAATQLGDARARLERTVIRAPFAGQVVRRHARPGETVLAGAALVELVDPRSLRFEAAAAEAEVGRLRPGDAVMVLIPAVGPRPLPGQVAEVIQAAAPASQGFSVKIDLDLPAGTGRGLRPGLAGTARRREVAAGVRPRLPLAALRRHFPREARAEVLVLDGDRLRVRPVQLGGRAGPLVEVAEGLHEGDHVVLSDPAALSLAEPVRAAEVAAP
jgi:membrane fusion protein (multidrug efflux system)